MQLRNPKAAEELAKEEAWREKKLAKVKQLAKQQNIKIENEQELASMEIHEAQELHGERKVCDLVCAQKLKDAAKSGRKFTASDLQ